MKKAYFQEFNRHQNHESITVQKIFKGRFFHNIYRFVLVTILMLSIATGVIWNLSAPKNDWTVKSEEAKDCIEYIIEKDKVLCSMIIAYRY